MGADHLKPPSSNPASATALCSIKVTLAQAHCPFNLQPWEEQQQDIISVFVGTWNMGGADPPRDITSWLQSNGFGLGRLQVGGYHDVYAFGTQVCSVNGNVQFASLLHV
jgi:hypothetical protein